MREEIDSEHDVSLPEAVEIEGESSVDDNTVLSLLGEMRNAWEESAGEALRLAQEVENAVYDRSGATSHLSQEVHTGSVGDNLSHSRVNHLKNLCLTYAARINEDRPRVRAFPYDATYHDDAAASAANTLLENQHYTQDLDSVWIDAAMQAQLHTLVGISVTYDPDSGPRSRFTGEKVGDVRVAIRTIFDLMVEDVRHIEDARWCVFVDRIDRHDAQQMLRDAGIDEAPPTEEDTDPLRGTSTPQKSGVRVEEIWHRPCARFPDGLFAVVIGNFVVEARSYPYEHGELPLALWRILPQRDTVFGSTHLFEAIPRQRYLNRLSEARDTLTDEWNNSRLIADQVIFEQIQKGNDIIKLTSSTKRPGDVAHWLMPPTPPPLIFDQFAATVTEIYDLFGLNEVLTGRENSKSGTSGRAIAYLKSLDAQKHVWAVRERDRALRRVATMQLSLYQQYMPDGSVVHPRNPERQGEYYVFSGAELDGFDVVLETVSGVEELRSTQGDVALEQAANGLATPEEARERAETGLDEPRAFSHAGPVVTQHAMQAVQAIASGQQPPPPPPGVAAYVAQQTINQLMSQNPQMAPLLQMVLGMYSQQQAATPQAGGGAPNIDPNKIPEPEQLPQ